MQQERILDVFPAADERQRLVIAACADDRLELRQESFSSNVGWFVQSRITIEPQQLAGLKAAMTGGQPAFAVRPGGRPPTKKTPPALRIAAAG